MKQQHSIDDYSKSVEGSDRDRVLRVRGLSVVYPTSADTRVCAICDASFFLARGEIVGIFGPSGAGKTSLGLALLNLLPPTAIRRADLLEFEGEDLLSLNERRMRSIRGKRIAIMHQEAALSLNPVMRVGQQISEVIRAHEACTRRERRERVLELLRSVGLSEAMYESYPHELSGGERHRIVIAQALACRPALVIADEPTAGLDPDLKTEVLKLILRLRTETGAAFLVVSHDRKMLAQLADRTLEMADGRLRECRPLLHATQLPSASKVPNTIMGMAGDSPDLLISIHALSKTYGKHKGFLRPRSTSVHALRDVNLSILSGSSLGLTGPSGSGKSTLAKCVAGWVKPDSGRMRFRGHDLTNLSVAALHRARVRIQLVLQDSAAAFNPNLTAEEIVEEPLLIEGEAGKEERCAAVKRLFLETGLEEDMLQRKPLTFSGGQRQRLAIARALILSPELVIFDESMTGLDTETQEQVLQLLTRIKAARNLTYILISHDTDLLSLAADTIATMRNGTITDLVHHCGVSEPCENRVQIETVCDARALASGEPA